MAILKEGTDEYEVRIKRYPDKTYFDEYVSTGEREKPDARKCDRYIIGEAGVAYTIEVTLKKGFNFGDYTRVRASVYLGGQHKLQDEIGHVTFRRLPDGEYRATTSDISKYRVCRDETLENETEIVGVAPDTLGFFTVEVRKLNTVGLPIARAMVIQPKTSENLWDAQKVDEESFSKEGVTYAVGFMGGHSTDTPQAPEKVWEARCGKKFRFSFHYHTEGFLARIHTVKYPPPLYAFDWMQLDKAERQAVVKELVRINKEYVYKEIEEKTGEVRHRGRKRRSDEPEEWCACSTMSERRKEEAFVNLKKSNKAYYDAEAASQIENDGRGVTSLAGGGAEATPAQKDNSIFQLPPDSVPKAVNNEAAATVKVEIESNNGAIDLAARSSISGLVTIESEGGSTIKAEPKIKNEPVDIDRSFRQAARLSVPPITPRKFEDDELERKKEKARALAEEIEMEERLAKLKRERRALQEEIDAAERKKQKSCIIIELDD